MLSYSCKYVFKKENMLVNLVMGAIFIGLLGYGCLKAYRWYDERKQKAAQTLFSEVLREYEKVVHEQMQGKQSAQALEQQWEDVVVGLQSVESGHSSTVYGAASYALNASIAMEKKHYDEALALMDKAIEGVSKNSPLYYVYKTKRALMLVDAHKVDEGLTSLRALAACQANNYADTAAFYLGYYYWLKGDMAQAKDVWKFFTDKEINEQKEAVSPWTLIVRNKLSSCA